MSPETASPTDTVFMEAALDSACAALDRGEFPVGCVIGDGQNVVAQGARSGTAGEWANEIDHAEINALRSLEGRFAATDRSALTLYCTMEPCLMCFSAIVLSGIRRIVYAYEDVMGGGSRIDRSGMTPLFRDARLIVVPGLLREKSLVLFQRFFANAENTYWADSLLSRYTLAQSIPP